MAGQGFLGNLYYSITGEDKLEEILLKDKKLAEEVAKIAGGIKIGSKRISQSEAQDIAKVAKEYEQAAKHADNFTAARKRASERQASGEFKEYIQSLTRYSDAQKQMSAYYRELEKESKVTNTAAGSIKMLEAELKKLRDTYRSLSEADRNSSLGQTMLKEINNADENLAKINAQMANNANLAKTMGTQYNGLRTQIGMVARELPNLGISIGTFITSLSNNLPYLADEIAKARKEYDNMIKTNQKATPVWKQMIGAVLNWQTALIVGVTVLVAYSREIQAWVQEMIKGNSAASILADTQKFLNELHEEAAKSASKELSQLKLLYGVTQDATRTVEERTAATEQLQKLFPDYLGKLSSEAILAGNAQAAYDALTISIKNSEKARKIKLENAALDEAEIKAIKERREAEDQLAEAGKELERQRKLPWIINYKGIQDAELVYAHFLKKIDRANSKIEGIEESRKKLQESYKPKVTPKIKVPFEDMSEYTTYQKTMSDLDRLLSMSVVDQEEYNKRLNDAKGILIDAADAAEIGGEKLEEFRKEYIAFNKAELAKKAQKTTDKEAKEIYKAQQEYLKATKALEDAVRKSERDIEQTRINLMEEGGEKQLAQLKLNFKKRMDEVKAQTDAYVKMVQDQELKAWKKKNPTKKESEFKPTTTDFNTLPQNLQNVIVQQAQLSLKGYEKSVQDLLDKTLEKYRDFDARRTAIEEDGNAEIAFLQSQRTDKNGEEIDRAIRVAKDKIKKGIKEINDEERRELAGQDNAFIKQLFGDVSQMGFNDLTKLIEQARQLRSYLSGEGTAEGITFINPDQLKAIEESPAELDKLKKALDGLLGDKNSWDNVFEGFTKGLAKLKSAKGFKDISASLQDIGGAASTASSMLSGVAGNLASMFEEMGNAGAADALSGVQDAMSAISNIGQGFAKGGIIGGIGAAIGEAANFIGKAFAAEARHQKALKQIMNEKISQQREYNLLLLQQNLEYEKAETIFGTDAYGKAANAAKVMEDAVADLNKELKGTGKYSGGYAFSLTKGFHDTFSKSKRELLDAYAGLADIEIKTGHKKTGLFGWGKGKDIYSSILDVYPDLIDGAGEFNREVAETIINTRQMSEEDKAALQNLIDLSQTAEDALQSMNDYLTSIFGDFGNTLSDALVDAFKNGTDAAKSFTSSVSDMLETLATQMIYSISIGPVLEEAQEAMLKVMKDQSLDNDEKFAQFASIMDKTTDNLISGQEDYNMLLEQWKQIAKDKGFEIFQPDAEKQNALSKGIQGVTEDTAGVIGSYLNAMRADLSVNRVNLQALVDNAIPFFNDFALRVADLKHLETIANNTGRNADVAQRILDRLVAMTTAGSATRVNIK